LGGGLVDWTTLFPHLAGRTPGVGRWGISRIADIPQGGGAGGRGPVPWVLGVGGMDFSTAASKALRRRPDRRHGRPDLLRGIFGVCIADIPIQDAQHVLQDAGLRLVLLHPGDQL